MADESLRRSHYLDALARLSRGLAHETRSHLGNVALQVRLADELIARESALDDGGRARLAAPLERARRGLERLEATVTRALGAAAIAESETADLDAIVRDLGPLLAPSAMERRVEWSARGAGMALPIPDAGGALREAVTIAAVRLMEAASPAGKLEARLETHDRRVSLVFEGACPSPGESWLEVVRASLAAKGGAIELEPDRARLTLSLPLGS